MCIIMGRSAQTFFATILVLGSLVLSSSALPSYDTKDLKFKKVFFLTEAKVTTEANTVGLLDPNRQNRFIGDAVIGEGQEGQTLYIDAFEISNPSDNDIAGTLEFSVNGVVHLVAILNQPESCMVICETPESLGSSTSVVGARIPANSSAKFTVIIGAH